MRVVTAEAMRRLDATATSEGGIPGAVLMENAGRAVVDVLATRYGPIHGRRYHVVCGVGNNGGDGLVVARLLHLAGGAVTWSLAGDTARVGGDSLTNLRLVQKAGVAQADCPAPGTVVIDALLGTGSSGAPRGVVAEAIDSISGHEGPVVSVDLPSGVDADTGATPGPVVNADATVTFAYPKLGLLLYPGAGHVGALHVADIGYPWPALDDLSPYSWFVRTDATRLLPKRPPNAHKGRFGHVLVVGGAQGMCGAAALAGRAALRSGAGLATIATPACVQASVAAMLPEAMTRGLPEDSGTLAARAADELGALCARASAICMGPGLGSGSGIGSIVGSLLASAQAPVVVDADGLNAMAAIGRRGPLGAAVLTPHPGECARLLDRTVAAIESDRIGAVRDLAVRYGCVVVLKGAATLVCDGRQVGATELEVSINSTGNAGMATGGSGDVLAGIIASLLAQGLGPFDAARLGAYVHGLAGDVAVRRTGKAALLAGDVADGLCGAYAELEGGVR